MRGGWDQIEIRISKPEDSISNEQEAFNNADHTPEITDIFFKSNTCQPNTLNEQSIQLEQQAGCNKYHSCNFFLHEHLDNKWEEEEYKIGYTYLLEVVFRPDETIIDDVPNHSVLLNIGGILVHYIGGKLREVDLQWLLHGFHLFIKDGLSVQLIIQKHIHFPLVGVFVQVRVTVVNLE